MYIDYLTDSITRLIQIVNDNMANETEWDIAVQMIKHMDEIPGAYRQKVSDI
mgnify:FL=1